MTATTRDRWVLSLRGPKASLDPARASAAIWEEELDGSGVLAPTAVVFLTNRECPFRCVMCDLWVHTLDHPVARGDIVRQIRDGLARLPPARQIKLYNAGSFFDPLAIPPDDDEEIARALDGFDRVIVESHPAFLEGRHGERCVRLRDRLRGRLEVAVGLETAHPGVLARLNKRMTVDSFRRAADFLRAHDIALRVFVLLKPPCLEDAAAHDWTCRSIDLAIECGATACTIIPTRGGNGAMEALDPPFVAPRLPALECAVEYGIARRGACRVFADLWDLERFYDCGCSPRRAARLQAINRTQLLGEWVECGGCQESGVRSQESGVRS